MGSLCSLFVSLGEASSSPWASSASDTGPGGGDTAEGAKVGEGEGEGTRRGSGSSSGSGSGEGSGVGSATHAFEFTPGPLCHWARAEAALFWGSSSSSSRAGGGVVSSRSARELLVSSGKLEACCGEATGESGAEAMTRGSGEAIGGVSGAWGEDTLAMKGDLTAS